MCDPAKVAMSRQRWMLAAVLMAMLAMVMMFSFYSRAMALRYTGLHETPPRRASPLVDPILIDL